MSRIGNKTLVIPAGVEVAINENVVTVKGPKGTLTREIFNGLTVKIENNELTVTRDGDTPTERAMHGTATANINNMLVGVTEGFRKTLNLVGVGYRAKAAGKGLEIALGFSHPVLISEVEGIQFTVEKGNTTIHIDGISKEVVGQVAAEIRANRKPEPYKGKGVKYSDEVVRRKEGKKA
jgi:large subunit ribosomal protein L6